MKRNSMQIRMAVLLAIAGLAFIACPTGTINDGDQVKDKITPPNNFVVKETTHNTITLSWDRVSGAAKYRIYRSDWNNGNGVYETKNLTVRFTNLTANKAYLLYISSIDTNGLEGRKSDNVRSVTLNDCKLTFKSELIEAETPMGVILHINWNAVNGADKYLLYRKDFSENTDEFALIHEASSNNEFVDRNVLPMTSYTYKIEVKRQEKVIMSKLQNKTTSKLASPKKIKASAADRIITLSWDAAAGSTGYTIYCAFAETGPYTPIGTQDTGTAYFVTTLGGGVPLTANTTYYFKVAARNENVDDDLADVVSATTGP